MDASKLLANELQAARKSIEDIEILIKEHPFKHINQRLRLRELQILYRTVVKSLEGGLEMFR